jgi:U4/U6.U5 tri-snRNP-associated protein 1
MYILPFLATQHLSSLTLPFYSIKMAEQSMNQDSLTLEETNKVRASLGLAPIGGATEGTPEPDEDEIAEDNYAKRREAEQKAKREQEIKDNITQ